MTNLSARIGFYLTALLRAKSGWCITEALVRRLGRTKNPLGGGRCKTWGRQGIGEPCI